MGGEGLLEKSQKQGIEFPKYKDDHKFGHYFLPQDWGQSCAYAIDGSRSQPDTDSDEAGNTHQRNQTVHAQYTLTTLVAAIT